MPLGEAMVPVPMTRVAVVAPAAGLRDALVRVADAGTVQIDHMVPTADLPISAAAHALARLAAARGMSTDGGGDSRDGVESGVTANRAGVEARLAATTPDLAALERAGRLDLLAGEDQLTQHMAQAVVRGEVAALIGWTPAATLASLAERLAPVGAAAAAMPRPRGVDPPTAAAPSAARRTFAPLVETYTTIPYADIDPTLLAGLSYAVMFGAMFGDVGHGALLVLGALLIRLGRLGPLGRRLAGLRPHWAFVAAAGAAAMVFGVAYGEFFGPTGLVHPALLSPMEQPVPMLAAGVGFGAVLLAGAYALGTINRVREGGWALALYAPAGVAGALVFVGAGLAVAAIYWKDGWLGLAAGVLALTGLTLAYLGLLAGAGGGAAGALQAAIEVFDLVIRLGANVVSFARLAAFGLTHAVLGWVVWTATVALWARGGAGFVAAVAIFLFGNAVAFGLEALVAGIQALRLEYYELFSRVFQIEGRPFRPWHVPTDTADEMKEAPCPPGSQPYRLSPSAPSPL